MHRFLGSLLGLAALSVMGVVCVVSLALAALSAHMETQREVMVIHASV